MFYEDEEDCVMGLPDTQIAIFCGAGDPEIWKTNLGWAVQAHTLSKPLSKPLCFIIYDNIDHEVG